MVNICVVEKLSNLNLPCKVLCKSSSNPFFQPAYWTNSYKIYFWVSPLPLANYETIGKSQDDFFTYKIKELHKIHAFNTLFGSWRNLLRTWWKPWTPWKLLVEVKCCILIYFNPIPPVVLTTLYCDSHFSDSFWVFTHIISSTFRCPSSSSYPSSPLKESSTPLLKHNSNVFFFFFLWSCFNQI